MTLTILKLIFSSTFLGFIMHLRSSSNIFVENHHFNVIYLFFLTHFRQLLVQYRHLHHLLKLLDVIWDCFCEHNFLDSIDQYVIEMFMINFSQNSTLVYYLESLSPNFVQGSRVIHFTMLAPHRWHIFDFVYLWSSLSTQLYLPNIRFGTSAKTTQRTCHSSKHSTNYVLVIKFVLYQFIH